jgi:hypothetical protein
MDDVLLNQVIIYYQYNITSSVQFTADPKDQL